MSEPADRRPEIWSRLSGSAGDLVALLKGLDEERWTRVTEDEGWPVALVGCHVSLGLRRQAKWIELVLRGQRPHAFDWERTHALNALVARRGQRVHPADVLRALAEGLERWRRLLMRMTDDDLDRITFLYQEHRRPMAWVAGVLAPRHIDEHLRSIRKSVAG